MRLCDRWGIWDVTAFMRSISYEQLCEWIAFHNLEPIGDEWRQTGMICATMANVWAGKQGKMLSPEDFMPIARRRVDLTPAQTVVAIRSLFGHIKKRATAPR